MLRQVDRSRRLTHEVQNLLPSPLADYCQVVDLHEHQLTLVVASPVWAAKLRYLVPSLLKSFSSHQQLRHITEINIKISKLQNYHRPPAVHRKVHMSPQSAELIRQTAESIDDPGLRQSLLKLSRRGDTDDDTQ
ncbi:MAG: DUF721 domain-containing protein [Gammaproteobacteria bacterium]|nr:DUF721 domain-containing protein [Gammaproteobacteria bacterium]